MQFKSLSPNVKRFLLIVVAAIGIIYVLIWIVSHSFISITVPESSGTTTYQLFLQGSKKPIKSTTTGKTIKKLVAHGTYEVFVQRADTSYFTVVRSGLFLTSKHVEATLSQESKRTFIGDNPGACMHYDGVAMVSNTCGGPYQSQRTHVPANGTTSTYTMSDSLHDGTLEGTIKTSEGILNLVSRTSGGKVYAHTIYVLADVPGLTSQPVKMINLLGVNPAKIYALTAYKTGFIAYDSSFTDVEFFASSVAAPVKININDSTLAGVQPLSLNTSSSDEVVALYGSTVTDSQASLSAKKSEVVVTDGSTSKQYKFATAYTSGTVCGTDKLCLLGASRVDVYDIRTTKPGLLFSISNAKILMGIGGKAIIANSDGIMSLDADSRTGTYLYTFGGYTLSGLEKNDSDLIVNIATPKGKKEALLVTIGQPNTDSIDKKLLQLRKSAAVDDLSAYNTFIYISLNKGQQVYDPNTGTSDYDPAFVQKAVQLVNTDIGTAGIDRTTYTFAGIDY